MRISSLRASLFIALVPLALVIGACSAGGTTASAPSPTPTIVPNATVLRVEQSQHFTDSKSGGTSAPCANGDPLINGDCGETVTAQCASGDVILSGGYAVDDPLAFVTSSFPASGSTWTVTAHDEGQDGGSHAVTVIAYAACLHSNVDAGVAAVSSTPPIPSDSSPHEVSQNCPAGTIVTGGGFRGTNGTGESLPSPTGWTAALSVQLKGSAKPQLFAVCAKNHLMAASQPKSTADPVLGSGDDLTVACPAGALLVGGGGHTVGYGNITILAPDSGVAHWQLRVSASGAVGGPVATYSVADYAVCATFS